MSKLTVIATFRIDDNGVSEEKLRNSLACESLRSIKVKEDDNDLYLTDATYKALCLEEKKIKQKKIEYFEKSKLK
jgi:hypothetical protein